MGKVRGNEILKEVISYSKIIILAAAAAWLINHTLILNAQIPTGSMENTVMTDSRIVVNRLAYWTDEPARGDIISFYYPDHDTEKFLKRIVALPGETIIGFEGDIYIDGVILEEPYVKEPIEQDFGPYTIPENSYFVMGDNRKHSLDSRYWVNKFVDKGAIIGKAEFEYFPEMKWLK